MLSRTALLRLRRIERTPCLSMSRHHTMATGVPRALAPWTACGWGSAARGAHPGGTPALGFAAAPGASRGKSAVAAVAAVRGTPACPSTLALRASRRRPRAVRPVPRAAEPEAEAGELAPDLDPSTGAPWGWTLVGCDSDAGGALVVVRGPAPGVVRRVSVLDCPTVKVEVNGKRRTRLCVEAMVALVASTRIPKGTVAHVEEGGVEFGFSAQTAFVQGYNFGLWKGVLASAGLDVRVVKPQAWKVALGLAHKKSTKDESRAMAGSVFPSTRERLRRKKDHGRAEALLIAAYGHVAASARGERDANEEAETESAFDSESSAAAKNASFVRDGVEDSVLDDSDVAAPRASTFSRAEDPLCASVREVVVRVVAERADEAAEGGDAAPEADTTLRRALGPDDPLPYFGPYFGMSGKQLAAEARARRLKVSGRKMELVARLEMDDAERRRSRRAREETREP